MDIPPCIRPGEALNTCARRQFEYYVEGKGYLPDAWRGWRIVGNVLVAPDRQRITVDRLAALMVLEKRFAGGPEAEQPTA